MERRAFISIRDVVFERKEIIIPLMVGGEVKPVFEGVPGPQVVRMLIFGEVGWWAGIKDGVVIQAPELDGPFHDRWGSVKQNLNVTMAPQIEDIVRGAV